MIERLVFGDEIGDKVEWEDWEWEDLLCGV